MACLSVPSPEKWILDILGTHIFNMFFGSLDTHFLENLPPVRRRSVAAGFEFYHWILVAINFGCRLGLA